MKLYAQHGYGDGQKATEALSRSLIGGVIFSPKDIPLDRLRTAIQQIHENHASAEIMVDPQFYACFAAVDPTSNLGNLGEEDYGAYFQPRRRSQLLSEHQLNADLDQALKFQVGLGVSAILAPNIIVPRSFDSTESAIAMDFIRNTRRRYAKLNDPRPVFATLAIAREALIDKEELLRFLNDVTVLDERPDGFYVLIAVSSSEARSEMYHADVIAGWMFINHVLHLNGYQVLNGYADVLSPFLGAVGGSGAATGWWSNLRSFSMDRFAPPGGGGRLPVERYLSCLLLNRIAFYELDQIRGLIPEVLNDLPTDALYPEGSSQPQRCQEVLQSWEAIRELNTRLVRGSVVEALRNCEVALEDARRLYGHITATLPQPLDPKSNDQHIEPLEEGIRLFASLAELDLE